MRSVRYPTHRPDCPQGRITRLPAPSQRQDDPPFRARHPAEQHPVAPRVGLRDHVAMKFGAGGVAALARAAHAERARRGQAESGLAQDLQHRTLTQRFEALRFKTLQPPRPGVRNLHGSRWVFTSFYSPRRPGSSVEPVVDRECRLARTPHETLWTRLFPTGSSTSIAGSGAAGGLPGDV